MSIGFRVLTQPRKVDAEWVERYRTVSGDNKYRTDGFGAGELLRRRVTLLLALAILTSPQWKQQDIIIRMMSWMVSRRTAKRDGSWTRWF
jgi:hypothetical protein